MTGLSFGAEDWFTDFRAAKAQAKKEKKDLFVLFTGSDWCPPCVALEQTVLSKKEFLTPVKKSFVLVKLDFPKKKKLPEAEAQANEALAEKYKIEGFPTFLLMTTDGEEYLTGFYNTNMVLADYVRDIEVEHAAQVAKRVQPPVEKALPKDTGSIDDLK
jgi:thioredoxin-related protein